MNLDNSKRIMDLEQALALAIKWVHAHAIAESVSMTSLIRSAAVQSLS